MFIIWAMRYSEQYLQNTCACQNLRTKVFWERFFREKTWKIYFHCIHTFMFVCITTHLFRFTCIHYLHTNATLHAISSCICELSSPACINKQGEEETVHTNWKTWLYFPWHHSSGINSVNVSLSFYSSLVQGRNHMATARHIAVLQGFHVAWCQNLCFAFPPRANLSHPFLTQSSLGGCKSSWEWTHTLLSGKTANNKYAQIKQQLDFYWCSCKSAHEMAEWTT